jgi:hypothetical protein
MAERKAPKSPPHVAAPTGAAKKRVQNRIAADRNSMLFLIVPRYWIMARGNGRGKAPRRRKRYRFKASLRHVHWQFPEEAISFAVLPEGYSTSAYVV